MRYRHWGTLENYYPKHCSQNQINNPNVVKDNEESSSNGTSNKS